MFKEFRIVKKYYADGDVNYVAEQRVVPLLPFWEYVTSGVNKVHVENVIANKLKLREEAKLAKKNTPKPEVVGYYG